MKSTIKFFLVIALFSSITLANDGNMGGGGFTDDGNMGGGGRPCTQNCVPADQTDRNITETDSLLEYVQAFLIKILG
jgi:hypothetical protein